MNEFKTYHPVVNFTYFVAVIGFSMFVMHPVCLMISLVCSFSYSALLNRGRSAKISIAYMLVMLLSIALINPLFNHEGVTVIGYFPGGNPITLESFCYGLATGVMIVNVISWFSCYNDIMTSDKFIYLFGKLIPSMSLIISMTLRFVPRFTAQLKVVIDAQKCIGCDVSRGSIIKRARYGLNILSAMITWALENSVETADSMKSRGYGIAGRTAFSIFKFDDRDKKAFSALLILIVCVAAGIFSGELKSAYFPCIKFKSVSFSGVCVFSAYFLLCAYPLIIELSGVRKWNALRSRI